MNEQQENYIHEVRWHTDIIIMIQVMQSIVLAIILIFK